MVASVGLLEVRILVFELLELFYFSSDFGFAALCIVLK